MRPEVRQAQERIHHRRAPSRSSPVAMILGVVAVAAVAAAGFWAIRAASARSGSAGSRSADQALFESVDAWVKNHPSDYNEGSRRYREILSAMSSQEWNRRVREAMLALEKQRSESVRQLFARLQAEADGLKQAGDYDGALAVLGRIPVEFKEDLSRISADAQERLRTEVEGKIKVVVARAQSLAKAGYPDRAVAALASLDTVRYELMAAGLKTFRAELEKAAKKQAEAGRPTGQEREAQELARQRAQLDAFRKELAAELKKREYAELAARCDRMAEDPALAPVSEEFRSDRRPLAKLAAAMDRVCTNVRGHVGKAARYRGAPAKIKSFDGKAVVFDSGPAQPIADMRGADLQGLLELDPDAESHEESVALLFIAEGDSARAAPHEAKVGDRSDIDRLKAILGTAGAAPPGPRADEAPAPADPAAAAARAMKTSEDLCRSYCAKADDEYKQQVDALRETVETKIAGLDKQIADRKRSLQIAQGLIPGANGVVNSSSSTGTVKYWQDKLREVEDAKARIVDKTKQQLAEYAKARNLKKERYGLLRDKHKRVMLYNHQVFTDEQITQAYEEIK